MAIQNFNLTQTGDEVQAILDKAAQLPTAVQLKEELNTKAPVEDVETARDAATEASAAAQTAAASAEQVATDVADLKEAIQDLPDGQAVSAQVAQNTVDIANLQAVVADLETLAEGYVRVAGSSNPALGYKTYKYSEQGGFGRETVFSLFYPCLVGTALSGDASQVGRILFVLQKFGAVTVDGVAMWRDINGNLHAIDGSEGDVMICNVEPYYSIDGKYTIEGTEYDVFLKSRLPFTWQGIEARRVEKFGWSPDYCVSHTDTDNVTRMHSVYNPAWNGSYTAPSGVTGKYVCTVDETTGDIVETFDADATLLGGAGGLHSTDINLPTGEQRAMNLNIDTTKTVPWMNQTAEGLNLMQGLLLSEGGTFDAHNATRMGSGLSANDPATSAADWEDSGSGAKNGMRVMDKDGVWKMYSLSSQVRFITGASSGNIYAGDRINSWRNPWHVMEAHRAVSYAIQHDVHELEWFVFEGCKYKYRSVEGFAGPTQGEMTCVVWKMLSGQAGSAAVDPTDGTTSIAGNRVDFLISTALLHGVTTQVSPSWWVSGLLFTEDENGNYEIFFEADQSKLVLSVAAGDYDPATPRDFETLYDHVGQTITKGDGYAKNYLNGVLMMPDTNANKSDGGLHTYVGKFNYFSGANANAGKKTVRGFRCGGFAVNTSLSPLCVFADASPSRAYTYIAFGTCCSIVG